MHRNRVVAGNGDVPAASRQVSLDDKKPKVSREALLQNITKRIKQPISHKRKTIEIPAPDYDPCIRNKYRGGNPLTRIAHKGIEKQLEYKQSKPSTTIIDSDSDDEDDLVIKSVVTIPSTSAINDLVCDETPECSTIPTPAKDPDTNSQDNDTISTTSENPDNDVLSKELTVSDSDEEDAATLEELITQPESAKNPEPTCSEPLTDNQKSNSPPVEEYVPTPSKPQTFPKYLIPIEHPKEEN